MTDERFEHDLKSVLREFAGGEAPMSLRNRLANLIDQAPLSRRLWFSPPMKLSLAAVTAVAVVVMAFFVVRPLVVGPTPSQTPGPSASSIQPSPSTQPTATLEPTPVPTPGVAAWTGLDWAMGTTVQGSRWNIDDIAPWGNGYVGVGTSQHGDHASGTLTWSPAFFTSADGLHWTLVQEGDPIDEETYSQDEEWFPARLVPVGDTLLAVGHNPHGPSAPRLWRTGDGLSWTLLDNPSWKAALTNNTLISVAAGPTGVVVVAYKGSGFGPQGLPLIIHSPDGVTWDRLDLSAVFDKAYFYDVTAYAGGFAIVGRVGEPNTLAATESARGVPAAWTSPDGVTWLAAEVEGSQAPGATLLKVVAGADGLFATGYPTEWTSWQSPRSGWASTDGRSWQLVGVMGTDLPMAIDLPWATEYPTSVLGDGAHMVMFGRESCKTAELSAWTSLDGVTWTQLAFSGATATLPTVGPICNDDGTESSNPGSLGMANAFVVPDGVIVVGSSSAPVAPSYWFLTATTH
jgi:hypothetical protein